MIKSDSIVKESEKKYSETITKYVNNCSVKLNGKSYTFNDFIELYIEQLEKNITLKDSLNKTKVLYNASVNKYGKPHSLTRKNDSTILLTPNLTKTDTALAYYKEFKIILEERNRYIDTTEAFRRALKFYEKRYGLKSNVKIEGDKLIFEFEGIEKMDSAFVLFPYYKHQLYKKDSVWNIDVDEEYQKLQKKARREEARKQRRKEKRN